MDSESKEGETVRASFRDLSEEEKNSLKLLSKMAHPHWHEPIRNVIQRSSTDDLNIMRLEMSTALATYINFAATKSEKWFDSFVNDVRLKPDQKEDIFEKHRTYYIDVLASHSKFKYLYENFWLKHEIWNLDAQIALGSEIWHITNKYNQELIEALWLVERVYACFFTVDKLNDWKKLQESFDERKVDTRYYIDENFIKSHDSEYLAKKIEEDGCFLIDYHGTRAKVYIGVIAAFFIANRLTLKNLDSQSNEEIDVGSYIAAYIEEFIEGEAYFNETYRVSPDVLFGPEAKEFGEGLHYQYFHNKGVLGGWNYWKKYTPLIVTHKGIRELGYYSGVISGFESMNEEYPDLFKKYVFNSCNISEGNVERKNDKNLIDNINNAQNEEQLKKTVRSILAPLNGHNPQKQSIMSEEDFKRLVAYTDYLTLHDAIPPDALPIRHTGISNEHIRFTFYRLHKTLFGTTRKRPTFIEFIHTIFTQFAGTSQATTNAKFSTAPKSYTKDFAGYIGEEA